VDPGTTCVVAADFRQRGLGQLDGYSGIVPTKVGQVQKHVRPQGAGWNLVRERLE